MTTFSRFAAWASALFLAVALFYAPLAYGCTRQDMLPPLFGLLGASFVCGLVAFLLSRHPLTLPGWALLCLAAILAQGWWIALHPVFRPIEANSEGLADTTYENIRHLSFDSMLTTTFLLGAFLALCELFRDARRGRFLLWTTALAGVLISVIGIVFKIVGEPITHYFWSPTEIDWNNFAFYHYHGNAGAFLNLAWPLILVFTRRAYSPRIGYLSKVLWTCCALACGVALLVNASKAALVIGLLILPWPFSTWLAGLSRKSLLALGAATVSLLVLGVIASSRMSHEDAFQRMTEGGGVTASAGGRFEADLQYIEAVPEVGFFGEGPGLFQIAFPYQNTPLRHVRAGLREFAHEDYFQTIIEWGWLGSVWWFLLVAGGLSRAFQSYRSRELFTSRTDRHLLLGAILGVLGILLHALVDFPLQVASIRLFFLVLLSFCWASPRLLASPPVEASARRPSDSAVPTPSHRP